MGSIAAPRLTFEGARSTLDGFTTAGKMLRLAFEAMPRPRTKERRRVSYLFALFPIGIGLLLWGLGREGSRGGAQAERLGDNSRPHPDFVD
jgi:hypothetical protein